MFAHQIAIHNPLMISGSGFKIRINEWIVIQWCTFVFGIVIFFLFLDVQ